MIEEEVIIDNRFCLGPKIGAGSFGEIYRATDLKTGEQVAAKVEPKDTKHPQLRYEYLVYDSIKKGTGFPNVRYFGVTEHANVMIMDLLGQSLEALFNLCSRKFSLKTILMLAIQLIDRIEYLHGNNYLHRDIKPDNFLIGANSHDCHVIYMVDMGLCKLYRDPRTHRHIPYRVNKKLTGTPRYASLHTHNGEEQGRRDDLESLGYMLIYFNHSKLPWQGLKARSKQEKYDLIGKKKRETSTEDLCRGSPDEFLQYMNYCAGLKFEEEPNYFYLKNLFYNLVQARGYKCDWVFDWDDLAAHEIYLRQIEAAQSIPSPMASPTPNHYAQTIHKLEQERDKWKMQCEHYMLMNQRLTDEMNLLKSQILALQMNQQLSFPASIVQMYGNTGSESHQSPGNVLLTPSGASSSAALALPAPVASSSLAASASGAVVSAQRTRLKRVRRSREQDPSLTGPSSIDRGRSKRMRSVDKDNGLGQGFTPPKESSVVLVSPVAASAAVANAASSPSVSPTDSPIMEQSNPGRVLQQGSG